MDILEKQLRYGLLYSRTLEFKRNLNITINSIKRFLDICDNPYLALSFGKQSIVLADIISRISQDVPMILLRSWETFIMHNMEDIIQQFIVNRNINLIIHYKDNVSWNNWSWKKTRDYGEKDLQNMGDEACPDWDGVIMGLSKDESVARRITCSKKTTEWATIFKYKNGKYRNTPIQFWNINDLAAYHSKYDLPLLAAYHQRGLEARTTARITKNNAEMNGLVDLKNRDISNYNKIVFRFPELSAKS